MREEEDLVVVVDVSVCWRVVMAAASGLEKLDAFAVSKVPVRSCLFVRPLPHRSDWLTMYEYAFIIYFLQLLYFTFIIYSYCIIFCITQLATSC